MEKQDKLIIQEYINANDPDNSILRIEFSPDYKEGTIKYSDKIKQNRHIEQLTDEEIVRAYLVVKLIQELGYPIEAIELEKEWEIGRKGKKPWARARADILVKKAENNFLLVEVKAPTKFDSDIDEIKTQLFNVASLAKKNLKYLIYYSVAVVAKNIQEKLVTINYAKFRDFESWDGGGRPNLLGIPKDYGLVRKPIFIKDVHDLITNSDQNTFNRLKKEIHNVLWGGGELSDTDIFNNLIKMFLAKIYDEKETPSNKAYIFQIDNKYDKSTKEYVEETNSELLAKISKLYRAALKDYLNYSDDDVQNASIDVSKFSINKMRYVIETFQSISITQNEFDLLGSFFEGIVWSGFKQTKGQYFTPADIVIFILYVLRIDDISLKMFQKEKKLPFIVDPACGSGTFLIEIMKFITKSIILNKDKLAKSASLIGLFNQYFPSNKENYWANTYIYGIEINQDLATASKVNMVMHGDGSANILCDNALFPFAKYRGKLADSKKIDNYPYDKPVNENFDILISNPPFSLDLDKETKKILDKCFISDTGSSSENLFIERWYQLLKVNGLLGVVLPESVFDVAENKDIRLFLYKYFEIIAVVSLPTFTFEPYTSTKTSLLFARKRTTEETRRYDDLWRKASSNFDKLKRIVQNLKKLGPNPTQLKEYETKVGSAKEHIRQYLGNYFDMSLYDKGIPELLNIYKHEIDEVTKNPEWWKFGDVSKRVDYEISLVNVNEIGYRRLLRSTQARPNELMLIENKNGKAEVIVDRQNPKNALDWLCSDKKAINSNWFSIKFSEIFNHFSLRLNVPYYQFMKFEYEKGIKDLPYKTRPFREGLVSLRNGKDVKKEYYALEETKYIYVLVNNIRKDGFNKDKLVYIVPAKGEQLSKYRLKKGDLIINRSIDVGHACCFDIDDDNIYIPCGFLMIARVEKSEDPTVIQHYLNTTFIQTYFQRHSTGKIQKSITQPDIKKAPLLSVSESIQNKLSTSLMEERKKISHYKREIVGSLESINNIILLK